jgi:hypothetical protein
LRDIHPPGIAEDARPGFQPTRANFQVKANATVEEPGDLFDTVCHRVQVETNIEIVD